MPLAWLCIRWEVQSGLVFVEAPVLGVCLLVCGNVFVRLVFLAHVHIGETAVAG